MAGDRISPSLAGLVERDDLIAEIVEQQARVVTRGGCLVWLSGEAGVGKTSVVRAVAGRLRTRILTGACDAMTTPRPLGPLLDMAATGGHRIAQALAADASRHGLFEALLGELSSPTLVVIEDVHWADEGTVDMLRFIGRRVAQTRSVVLVTYRSDELDAHPDLRIALGDLAAAPACRRLEVAPLSLDGVRTMAEGHALDASRLHDVTGGNPFFVTEVLSTQNGRCLRPSPMRCSRGRPGYPPKPDRPSTSFRSSPLEWSGGLPNNSAQTQMVCNRPSTPGCSPSMANCSAFVTNSPDWQLRHGNEPTGDGPSPEAIRDVAERNGLPVDNITPVSVLNAHPYQ